MKAQQTDASLENALAVLCEVGAELRAIGDAIEEMGAKPQYFIADEFFGMTNEIRTLLSRVSDAGMTVEGEKIAQREEMLRNLRYGEVPYETE